MFSCFFLSFSLSLSRHKSISHGRENNPTNIYRDQRILGLYQWCQAYFWRRSSVLFCENIKALTQTSTWASLLIETKNRRKKKDLLHNRPLTNHTLVVLLWTRAFLDIQTERQCFGSQRCYSSKVLSLLILSSDLTTLNRNRSPWFELFFVICWTMEKTNERKITFKIESYSFTIKSSSSSPSSCCSLVFAEI